MSGSTMVCTTPVECFHLGMSIGGVFGFVAAAALFQLVLWTRLLRKGGKP